MDLSSLPVLIVMQSRLQHLCLQKYPPMTRFRKRWHRSQVGPTPTIDTTANTLALPDQGRLFRSRSSLPRKSERIAGSEFGHATHNTIRLFCVDACVSR